LALTCRRSSRPEQVAAAFEQALRLLAVRSRSSAKVTFLAAGSLTSGLMLAVFGVGPAPATKRLVGAREPGARVACQARAFDVHRAPRLQAVVGLGDARRAEVLVSTMSAPARRYASWIASTTSGRVS
jgi:hypothetical protein